MRGVRGKNARTAVVALALCASSLCAGAQEARWIWYPGDYGIWWGNELQSERRRFGKSLCHAWGASPVYLLGRYFLGVVPTSPGFATYDVKPNLGGLDWYMATLVTLYCALIFSIQAFTLHNIVLTLARIAGSSVLSVIIIFGLDTLVSTRREKRL